MHHYLPSLIDAPEEGSVAMPQRAAHWEEATSSLLHDIANLISVGESSRARGVSSISSPWLWT